MRDHYADHNRIIGVVTTFCKSQIKCVHYTPSDFLTAFNLNYALPKIHKVGANTIPLHTPASN